MKLNAKMGHWSSVVGNSVHLHAPDGRRVGQVAFLCHDDTLRDKDVQTELARVICDAINDAERDTLQARAEAALASARAEALREAAEKLRDRYNTVENDQLLWAHDEVLALIPTPRPDPVREADLAETPIDGPENYYGCLWIKCEGGKPFWAIADYNGMDWFPCPAPVFAALRALANGGNDD
jgi:hypothetical protein